MLARLLAALGIFRPSKTSAITVREVTDDLLRLDASDAQTRHALGALAREHGGHYSGFLSKHWHVPYDVLPELSALSAELRLPPHLAESLERYMLSHAVKWDAPSHAPEGFGVRLYPFQEAAVAYLLRVKQCVLGDEAGVGKTFAAIAAASLARQGSAIVVCPANLKLNWASEINRARPTDSIHICKGRSPESAPNVDWLILNYEIAAGWVEMLRQVPSNLVIFDEIHNCKNPGAQRSQACLEIAEGKAYRFGLTGTLFRNRHAEAFYPLRVIGQLDALGGRQQLLQRFCGGTESQSVNSVGFNRRLRCACYARREKRAVLAMLPQRTRSHLVIEMDGVADYRRNESGLIAWLRSVRGDKARWKQERMNALAKMNALRMQVGQQKVKPAVEWISDLLDQSDEKLVVFAYHTSVQHALAQAFPDALHIFGADSMQERQRAKDAFQSDPAQRLILCSLSVASEGITLTAASTLLSLELDYVPARLFDQMEGRIDRNGQTKPTQMYYMIADASLDQRMMRLLEGKWRIVTAANTGQAIEADGSIFDALVDDFLK